MKNLVQYITVSIALLVVFSCNNDFLKGKPDFFGNGSPIVISPDWEAQDYTIYCVGVGNAMFTVSHAPSWLKISSPSGQVINNVATLNCKANVHSAFSEIGIYHSFVTLSVEGRGSLAIPVSYITEGNPVIEIANSLTIGYNSYNSYYGRLSVRNTGKGILFWSISELPEWLSNEQKFADDFYSPYILSQNAEGVVNISYNPNIPFQENLSGKIVITTNDKNKPTVVVDVRMDLGNPVLDTSWGSGTIDFGRTETTRYFSFSNQGNNGILVWKIEGCPEWLNVSETNGILSCYNSTQLTFTCNRELMPPGANTVTIYLKTNDKTRPSYPITVTARSNIANPDIVKVIDGIITDAYLDKQTDILYLTTAQPNRFVAYDINAKTVLHELDLTKAPTCFSLSEDGSKAVIGHSGTISVFNLDNFTLTKAIEISYEVYDIAWTDGDWYCYTQKGGNFTYLHFINTVTESVFDFNDYPHYADGATNIGKVPGKPYIIAARRETSPTGIFVYDINTQSQKNYIHQSIGRFWFSSDGTYLFESYEGGVYKTADLEIYSDFGNLAPVSRLKIVSNQYYYYNIDWIDFDTKNLWVLYNSIIYQLEAKDYYVVKTYYYDDIYDGRPIQAHYVFANKSGTELVVIRNATNGEPMWSLEFIQIEEQ